MTLWLLALLIAQSPPSEGEVVIGDYYERFDERTNTFRNVLLHTTLDESPHYWHVFYRLNGQPWRGDYYRAGVRIVTIEFDAAGEILQSLLYMESFPRTLILGPPDDPQAPRIPLSHWETDIFERENRWYYYEIFFDRHTLDTRRARLIEHHRTQPGRLQDPFALDGRDLIAGPMIQELVFDEAARLMRQEVRQREDLLRVLEFQPSEREQALSTELTALEGAINRYRKPFFRRFYRSYNSYEHTFDTAVPRGLALRDQHWRVILDVQARIVQATYVESPNLFSTHDVERLRILYDIRKRPLRVERLEIEDDGSETLHEVFTLGYRQGEDRSQRARTVYNRQGRAVIEEQESYRYDDNRLTHIDVKRGDEAHAVRRYTYDEQGWVSHVAWMLLADEDRPPFAEKFFKYDAFGRLTEEVGMTRGTTDYRKVHGYNEAGQLVRTLAEDMFDRAHTSDTFWTYGAAGPLRQTIHFPILRMSYVDRFDTFSRIRSRVVLLDGDPQSILHFNTEGDVIREQLLDSEERVAREYRFSHNTAGGVTEVQAMDGETIVARYTAEDLPEGLFGPMQRDPDPIPLEDQVTLSAYTLDPARANTVMERPSP